MEVLIEKGANVNGCNIEKQGSGIPGVTPLLAALTNTNEDDESYNKIGAVRTIEVLLSLGADPHQVGRGMVSGVPITPLHAAIQWPEAAVAMLKHTSTKYPTKYDINAKCKQIDKMKAYKTPLIGYAPLHLAAQNMEWKCGRRRGRGGTKFTDFDHCDNLELMLLLLAYNGSSGRIDINQQTDDGQTPLHLICEHYSEATAVYNPFLAILVAHSAVLDVDALNADGLTALQVLCTEIGCFLRYPGYISAYKFSSVALLVTFGADRTHRSELTDKSAQDMVSDIAKELVAIDERYYSDDPKTEVNVTAIKIQQWFAATSGWSPLAVGAGCRFYREIETAFQRGVFNLDSFALCELKDAVAKANATPSELDWDDAPEVCQRTVRLMNAAVTNWRKGWIPAGHQLFHSGVRTAVHAVLVVAARLQQLTADESKDHLPVLPTEIWQYIMNFFLRSDWEVPPLDKDYVFRLMQANNVQ